MTKLVVLSTPLHYDRFLHEGFDLKGFEVWCDDERHYTFFENKKVSFKKLEENLIAQHWEEINTWACETAGKWIAFCHKNEIFGEIDWAMVMGILLGYLLAPILKSYHFSKLLISPGKYDCVIIFTGHTKKDYHKFLGNTYLNYFFELQCQTLDISTVKINLEQGRNPRDWQPETRSYLKANIFPHLKRAIHKVYAFFVKPKKSLDVLAFGSLRHLGAAIAELNKKGVKIALYDYEFHTEQFLFCIKERIPYLLPECFPNKIHLDGNHFAKQCIEQFNQACKRWVSSDLFVYDGIDLKEFIQNHLFGNMPPYFLKCGEGFNHYKNMTSVCKIKSVLIEDDFSIQTGFFAGYFNSIKLRVFCVSHANFAVNVRVAPENCQFYQSYTLVNSEFEKSNYVRRGWEPNHIVVTGTPRYDRLISLTERRRRKTAGKIKLLFCGTGLWSFSPDVYGYIGHQIECFGEIQLPALQAVFSAIKDLPVDLVIKPHSFEMLPLWKKLIAQSPFKKQIILKKHSEDTLKLLLECDAMILAYWSTTIIESAIAKTPTIYIDLRKVKSQLLYEYSRDGFCYIANSKASLREAVQKICNREHSFFAKPVSDETRRYYLGQGNGKAAERTSDFIITKLSEVV